MAIAEVGTATFNSGSGATWSATRTVTAGSLLRVVVRLQDEPANNTTPVSSSPANTWVVDKEFERADGEKQTLNAYALNAASGSTTISGTTQSGGGTDWEVEVTEFSGIATSSALDATASDDQTDSGSGADKTSTQGGTTAQAESIAIGTFCDLSDGPYSWTALDSYTLASTSSTNKIATTFLILSSTVAEEARATCGGTFRSVDCRLAVFKGAGGAGTSISPPQGNLSLSTSAPSVSVGVSRDPGSDDLILSPTAPTRLVQHLAAPAQGNLALSPTAPTKSVNTPISPGADDLLLSPTAPSVFQAHLPAPGHGNLILSSVAPTKTLAQTIQPGSDDLVFSSLAPSLLLASLPAPAAGQLAFSSIAPSPVITPLNPQMMSSSETDGGNEFTKPSGLQTGDVLVLVYWAFYEELATPSLSGFTTQAVIAQESTIAPIGVNYVSAIFTKVITDAGSEPASYTVSRGGATTIYLDGGELFRFSNVNLSTVVEDAGAVFFEGDSGTWTTGAAITTSSSRCTLIGVISSDKSIPTVPSTAIQDFSQGFDESRGWSEQLSSTLSSASRGGALAGSTGQIYTTAWIALAPAPPAGVIEPPSGNLVLTGATPTRFVSHAIAPAAGDLVISTLAPSAGFGHVITPGADQLIFEGFIPSLGDGVTVQPSAAQLLFSGSAPSRLLAEFISPSAGSLLFSTFAPGRLEGHSPIPLTGELVLTGAIPAVGGAIVITPDPGQLVITGAAPSVHLATFITPNAGQLVLSGFAPILFYDFIFIPITGQLVFTGFVPLLSGGDLVFAVLDSQGTVQMFRGGQLTDLFGRGASRITRL